MNDLALPQTQERAAVLRRALGLEYLTIGWNVVEGVIAVTAALAASSVALLGFGVDSFIECASGLVLVWRLKAERRLGDSAQIDELDARAHKLVGASLFLLAAWVAIDAGQTLWTRERPEPSLVGVALTIVSIAAMLWLARAKRRAAAALSSRALEADAFQTTACFWLSVITLAGIGLNAALGWWWADPVAALAMTWFLVKEGREAWRGEDCGCAGGGLACAGSAHAANEASACGCGGDGAGQGCRGEGAECACSAEAAGQGCACSAEAAGEGCAGTAAGCSCRGETDEADAHGSCGCAARR